MTSLKIIVVSLAALGCGSLSLARAVSVPLVILNAADEDSAYTAGTKAMNESRWSDAVTAFDQVIEAKSKKSDAALYWKAYSLSKLDKKPLASATCAQLRSQFRASDWNRDCSALQLTFAPMPHISPTYGSGAPGADANRFDFNFDFAQPSKDPDLDLKMLALNSLTHRDPAQALPILQGVLSGNQPLAMKQHAIFVLTQSKSPGAQAMIRDLVLGKQGLVLQRQAIQASSIFVGKHGNDALAEAYRATSDPQIKKAIISAFFISADDTRMVELARSEKNMDVKRSIVSQLSLMQGKAASDYMMELLK